MAGPNKQALEKRAKDLDVSVEGDKPTKDDIAAAILAAHPDDEVALAHQAAESSSGPSTSTTTPASGRGRRRTTSPHPDEGAPGAADDDEVRERDAARTGGRAGVNIIDVPARPPVNSDAPRAQSRGVYRDGNGDRRIVAAGDVIPDGWTHVEDAPTIEERTEAARQRRLKADGR